MSVDIHVFVGQEEINFPFGGRDTAAILDGISAWSGVATIKFITNYRRWLETVHRWEGDSLDRVLRLAAVNGSYVTWRKW